jgi:hypothetical protein
LAPCISYKNGELAQSGFFCLVLCFFASIALFFSTFSGSIHLVAIAGWIVRYADMIQMARTNQTAKKSMARKAPRKPLALRVASRMQATSASASKSHHFQNG